MAIRLRRAEMRWFGVCRRDVSGVNEFFPSGDPDGRTMACLSLSEASVWHAEVRVHETFPDGIHRESAISVAGGA